MNIGITGAGGFVGSRLAEIAASAGHAVTGFSREAKEAAGAIGQWRVWDLRRPPDLTGLDAVVNLAGESIMGLWTARKKRRIYESRVEGARLLAQTIQSMQRPPGILINASAVGYYGDTGEREVTEDAPSGSGFLAGVAKAWESEALKALDFEARVACVRFGLVIGVGGGAIQLMLPVFRAGLGGKLGSGRQWMSCVHVDDAAGIILHALGDSSLRGPFNGVMPAPVRNSEFARTLAEVVHRPAVLPAPAPLMRLALGDFSHLLLDSQRVVPKRTLESGYRFRFPNLRSAFDDVCSG